MLGALLIALEQPAGAQNCALLTAAAHTSDNESDILTFAVNREITIKSAVLDKNRATGLPVRVYIDFYDTCLSPQVPKTLSPRSTLIERIRIAQRQPTTVRVVCEVTHLLKRSSYSITHDAAKGLVEVRFPSVKKAQAKKQRISAPPSASLPIKSKISVKTATMPPSPRREPLSAPPSPQASTGVAQSSSELKKPHSDHCLIVIDPGHGGKDPGAIGFSGIQEKDVCLALAKVVKKRLEQESWCTAILTRTDDRFVSLSERAKIANAHNANLFISLHTNAHDDATLTGIETYYLAFSSDEDARRVAARENFTSPEAIGDLEMILFDLLQSTKINASSIFAGHIHNALIGKLTQHYTAVRNLGVKHAPLRVLIDADMPCVIIEVAFITNPDEARRLTSIEHQQLLADAIVEGIRSFKSSSAFAAYSVQPQRF